MLKKRKSLFGFNLVFSWISESLYGTFWQCSHVRL